MLGSQLPCLVLPITPGGCFPHSWVLDVLWDTKNPVPPPVPSLGSAGPCQTLGPVLHPHLQMVPQGRPCFPTAATAWGQLQFLALQCPQSIPSAGDLTWISPGSISPDSFPPSLCFLQQPWRSRTRHQRWEGREEPALLPANLS